MSRMWWSNRRPKTRLCGRFFECVPKANSDASFFCERNSIGVASSNGCTALCRLRCTPYGFFSMNRSMRMLLISPEVFWPRTSRAVFGFSLSFASRFLRKRRARDVFAVFESTMRTRRARL